MFPQITVFGRVIGIYALIAIAAGLLVGVILCRRISKLGFDDNDAIMLLLLVAVGVLVGGSLLYAITNLKYFPYLIGASSFEEFTKYLGLMFGGSVFYGGFLGGTFAGWLYAVFKKLDKVVYLDAMAPLIPLFHGFARLGCFFGGCCYGIESDFGVVVHNNPYIPEINGVRRFPVQLLESAGEFVIFFILEFLYLKIWRPRLRGETAELPSHPLCGRLFPLYLILYPVLRFFDEFLRGDAIRGFVFGGLLSTSQFISIILFAAAVVWLVLTRKKEINV